MSMLVMSVRPICLLTCEIFTVYRYRFKVISKEMVPCQYKHDHADAAIGVVFDIRRLLLPVVDLVTDTVPQCTC